ncbi:MAG TPA: DUF2147 domain-containing protein [Hyphomonadaceae bacterium]|jgi:Uncharacterized protein conserved in bacteria|nr:DUF2147 domain-containing protein [Hyphomonadaceae bacterium]
MKQVVIALALAGFANPALAGADVMGRWLTQDGSSIVEIKPCGDSICGSIVWFDELEELGPDVRDARNKDPAQRERRILGLQIIDSFSAVGDQWKDGRIYDPRKGRTFRAEIALRDPQQLRIKGCIGPICQNQTWTRAPAQQIGANTP